jgi:hypothetical protein
VKDKKCACSSTDLERVGSNDKVKSSNLFGRTNIGGTMGLSSIQRDRIRRSRLKRQNNACYWCGRPLSEKTISIDHIYSKFCKLREENKKLTVGSCEWCNQRRSHIEQALKKLSFVGFIEPTLMFNRIKEGETITHPIFDAVWLDKLVLCVDIVTRKKVNIQNELNTSRKSFN